MSPDRLWFVIAGGGTGGHLYPGLAVAEAVRRRTPDCDVTVFGTERPIDRQLVEPRGYDLVPQPVKPFTTKPWRWPAFLSAWRRSVSAAQARFNARRPAAVLGLGGYAAGPPITAALKLGIPTAIFNPDAEPGRANRHLGAKVACVFVQWEETASRFPGARRVVCAGCPVRPEFATVDRSRARAELGIDPAKHVLLVTGASQGARSINQAVLELADLWRASPDWQLVHLTGRVDYDHCRQAYHDLGLNVVVRDYTEKMAAHMAAADLVISRAGASTLAEITALGLPSILLPYPYDRKQHQTANARVLSDRGAAALVPDAADTATNAARLRPILRDLIGSNAKRAAMATAARSLGRLNAADRLAEQCLTLSEASVPA